jgi:hypothetical protein
MSISLEKVTSISNQAMKRIMYIENKSEGLDGLGRIGWVELSKSGQSFYYQGRRLQKTKSDTNTIVLRQKPEITSGCLDLKRMGATSFMAALSK